MASEDLERVGAAPIALVTGAARGIGAATAARFAARGAAVVLADVLPEVEATAAALGPSASAVRLDVSDADGWAEVVGDLDRRFGRLDVLVNNAGVLRTGTIEEMDPEDYLAVFRVNQLGPWLGIRAAAPLLRRADAPAIVNLASTAALAGLPGASAYSATKAAVRSLTKVAALELADGGVRVNSVIPGAADTAMSTRAQAARTAAENPFAGQPVPRAATVDEIAAAVVFLALDATYCTGTELVVDGGVTAALPTGAPARLSAPR